MLQDVIDEWLSCQRAWLYLEPIFSSEDINRQLPVESKRYQTMERMWRKILKSAKDMPQVQKSCVDRVFDGVFRFEYTHLTLFAFLLIITLLVLQTITSHNTCC